MKKILLLIFFVLPVLTSLAQSNIPVTEASLFKTPKSTPLFAPNPAKNYLRTFVPQKPIQDSSLVNMGALIEDVFASTQYFDDLGRPLQTVTRQASPLKKDYVAPVAFDGFGLTSIQYLPYVAQTGNADDGYIKTQAIKADSAFYKSMFAGERIYYGQQFYDGSPLGRVIRQNAPGNSWNDSDYSIRPTTRANTTADSVRVWTMAISNEDDVPTSTAIYPSGSLMVQEIRDERGIKSVAYTDELGRKIMTKAQLVDAPGTGHTGWLCTYYVYDEMGSLRMVIPPKAVEALNTSSVNWNLAANSAINNNFCYAYWFDNRGRATMKRIPGKGKIYIAYDKLDRVVMTQDANLRATSQWAFIQYDAQSRPTQTGLITMTGVTKDVVLANAAASYDYPTLTGTYTINAETYYDDYSFVSGSIPTGTLTTTNINSTNFITTYNTSPDYAQQLTQGNRTRGSVTGSKKIVIGTSTYLYTVTIYDDRGHAIQTKQTNYTGGTDVATVQYSFAGRVLRSHLAHQKLGNTTQSHTLLTKYSYDHAGRLKNIVKNIDVQGDKTIVQNSYNELGQLSSKTLGTTLETQNFSYNIRGWLLGINKTYVETANSTSNYFGEAFFYDGGFTTNQFNGNIAGVKWKGTGDDIQRAYGFDYDNTNRLIKADFSQQNEGSTTWTNDKLDFSVSGLNYDANGNILTMKQRGVNVSTPVTIDSLTYQYFTNSNQLQKVSDGISDMGPWGDFKDTTLSADDYVYDVNGNIVKDNNKHIHTSGGSNGITYNFLDKPTNITVNGKGTIDYVYDAGGALLQKTTTDTKTGLKTISLYVAGFVYQKSMPTATSPTAIPDTLQYTFHEEGRIRNAQKKNSSTGAMYYALEYDYFLKDHLGNIRTVLTEGKDTAVYVATMEPANQTTEQALFENEYDPALTVSNKPTAFDTDNANTKVAKLNPAAGYSKPTGPGIMLKVMAGDKVQLSTYGYYNTAVQAPGGTNPFTDLLSAITGSVIGNSGGKLTSSLTTNVSNAISPNLTDFLSNRAYNNTRPKAYLNWILLDEQLNYVSAGSNATQIPTVAVGGAKQPLAPGLQTMPKSGYLYVYVSNESPQPVYFDDITVQHFTGPLVSEESYYSFGGSIAALKSYAALKTPNSYKYNAGTELNESFDVDYYETYFRNYDAQIGRFTGVDILSELTLNFSPYVYAANDPIYWNDPTGAVLDGDPEHDQYMWDHFGKGPSDEQSEGGRTESAGGENINFGGWYYLLDQLGGGGNGGYINFGGEDSFTPRTIGESKDRRKGEDTNNEGSARDIRPYGKYLMHATNEELLDKMSWIFFWGTLGTNFTSSDMGKVAQLMFAKFKEGKGGEFTNPLLSNAVKENPDFMTWLNGFAFEFQAKINAVNGDVNKLGVIGTDGPKFGWNHVTDGLAITLDAFNYTEIKLTNFEVNPSTGQYLAHVHIYLEDAFGLDKNDVLSKGWTNSGFAAWWLLQHTRGFKFLSTKIELNSIISGNLNR